MKQYFRQRSSLKSARQFSFCLFLLVGGMLSGSQAQDEPRGSLAGERAAQELKRAMTNEVYNLKYGPVRFQTEARLGFAYTDNVFLSGANRRDDFIINPEIKLAALLPVSELNILKLSLGLSYEYFVKNTSLNSGAPLVSPDSELVFHVFAGDFHIKLHEKFSYEQTLVLNQMNGDQVRIFNFNDVGRFDRLNNFVGPMIDWDLNKVILSLGYDHENFISTTERFKYLDRSSEWFRSSANVLIGDKSKAGLEGQFALHDYDHETLLNDNWRARVGPFAEFTFMEGVSFRAGGGYDMARFDNDPAGNSEYDTYYAYAKIRQQTRLFTHSLAAGRETMLGDNANNLRSTYVRYSISSDALIQHVDTEAHFSVNFCREFGGAFREYFVDYVAGLQVGYQFQKYCRADVGYEIFVKDSETALRDFHRNRVTVDVTFRF
jgi:hypothetical protein